EIDNLSDDELFKRIPDIDVFARVAPHHKFRIVKQLQAHGNLVAMTGDGVNDAPALKQADIGVAMGSGTDVAKESAQMVLMDDNFASIVQAVRRGRVILHNLQHILIYILATSFGGLLTIAVSVLAGMPLPLLPAQLLWVNLVTDGTSTVPLAFEKEHGNVMVFPPRRKGSSLITKAIIKRIIFAGILMMLGTLGVYYIFIQDIMHLSVIDINNKPVYKLIYMKAQTVAFCILAFYQIWNVQNSRSIDRSLFFGLPYSNHGKLDRIGITQNKILLGIMLLALVLQIAAVELPFMNIVFNTIPLNFIEWLLVITVSFSIIILVEISKYISARFTSLELNKKLVV
ncbi:MAG: family hydrolase, partial [Bacteroidota bacterium]|nr:family hydrolase [Bacteroidota bacterium]